LSIIHSKADVVHCKIATGIKVWKFVCILESAIFSESCNIRPNYLIERDVWVSNSVTVYSDVYLWTGVIISDNVFVGPSVGLMNDLFTRFKQHLRVFAKILVFGGTSIGASATTLAGVTVGAGAVVTRDVPERAVVADNPAKILRYTDN